MCNSRQDGQCPQMGRRYGKKNKAVIGLQCKSNVNTNRRGSQKIHIYFISMLDTDLSVHQPLMQLDP